MPDSFPRLTSVPQDENLERLVHSVLSSKPDGVAAQDLVCPRDCCCRCFNLDANFMRGMSVCAEV